jgi:hypothetical protein
MTPTTKTNNLTYLHLNQNFTLLNLLFAKYSAFTFVVSCYLRPEWANLTLYDI